MLTKDALLSRDSAILKRGSLIEPKNWDVERFINDGFLVNEWYHGGLIDPVVFENFIHFLDLFEELCRDVEPEQISEMIQHAINSGQDSSKISQQVGE